jgi:PAS domain S-box-containing protein
VTRYTDLPKADLDFLIGGGEMGERMRALDWAKTPLGPAAGWPQSLKTIVRVMLDSRYAMWMLWGPEFTFFCNDAYLPTVGIKRDWVLGARADKVWDEIWPDIGPRIQRVLAEGRATWDEALLLFLERSGFPEETYHTFSYSPVYDDGNRIAGMLCVVTEVTERVISERRLRVLRDLAQGPRAQEIHEACRQLLGTLALDPLDVPFACLYMLDPADACLRRAQHYGALPERLRPAQIALADTSGFWPIGEALRSGAPQVVDLRNASETIRAPLWPDRIGWAIVLPVQHGSATSVAVLIAGVSPRRPLDDAYRGFFELAARQFGAAIADVQSYEGERRRAEALAEIDRAKTVFFSNVSHEFRTPLTLMLGPIGEIAGDPATPAPIRAQLELAHRNSVRLLKLVNSLLDFSRFEAGRVQASYERVDLAALTRDLASSFRSAIVQAGLEFSVECQPLPEPVYADRDMWEQVVLNLISNAFKFTFHGTISVRVREERANAVLEVSDTGVGVPSQEIPRLFERFHRVEGTVGRTHEGSGIGLALVQEIVKLHGAAIEAVSELGRGTTFQVRMPFGKAHLPADRILESGTRSASAARAASFAQEALRWLPDSSARTPSEHPTDRSLPGRDQRFASTFGARIVLADDNADMRAYVWQLLAPQYLVETVADGEQALAATRRQRPELILSDVMMPRLDGFGLLKAIRGDEELRDVPVILLSARAGGESRIEGLDAGADDYLFKPFTARELLARVGALIELTRSRAQSEQRLRLALTSIQDQFFLLDENWRYTLVNRRVIELTGRAERDLVGHSLFEIVPDLRGTHFETELLAAAETGTPRRFESYHAGGQRWFENTIYPASPGVAVLVTDVTDRKQAQEAFRLRTAQFETLLNEAPLGMYLVDADFRIREVNPVAKPVFGDIPDLIGRDFGDVMRILWKPAVADETIRIFRHTLETGESYLAPERIEQRLDRGVTEYYEWLIHRIPLTDGRQGVVCYFRDISAHVRAREQMRAADRQKDEFLAMLAHELRNPLAPIYSASELLSRTLSEQPQAQAAIATIKRQATQLTRLVDDLLDVSRITQGRVDLKRVTLDLSSVIAQALETVDPLIREKRHQVLITASYQPLYVCGDFVRLVQCVINLLTNAAKYTDAGGHIHVETRREDDAAVIGIVDNGVGMSPELLPRVFDLFVQSERTLDRSQGGLGIGLSVVKRLIEMHGGRVGARSAGVGRGSTFEITLPLVQPPAAAAGEAAPLKTSPKRIFIVDDNADAADTLALLLELEGHVVRAVHTPADALRQIESFKPDVALVDIGLPELDGYELVRRLRKQPSLAAVRFVAVTGYGQVEDRRRVRDAGFNDHLVKPVSIPALERTLSANDGQTRDAFPDP